MTTTAITVGETIAERKGWRLWQDSSGYWYMSSNAAFRLTGYPNEETLTDDEVVQRFKDGHYDSMM